jgi:hypothetical protein
MTVCICLALHAIVVNASKSGLRNTNEYEQQFYTFSLTRNIESRLVKGQQTFT